VRRATRARFAILVLTVAGFATVATEPSPPTSSSAIWSATLNLTDAAPTETREVVIRIDPGALATYATAEISVDGTLGDASTASISIVRESDGLPVVGNVGPISGVGRYGATISPFVACPAAGSCEARFSVTLHLQGPGPLTEQWQVQVSDAFSKAGGPPPTVLTVGPAN
jgi:hypothetical protein